MAIVSGYMKDWYVIVSQHDDIEEEHNTCEWNVRYQWNERNIYQSISKMFVSIQNDMKTKTEIENKMPLIEGTPYHTCNGIWSIGSPLTLVVTYPLLVGKTELSPENN